MLSWIQAVATIILGVASVWWSRRASKHAEPVSNGWTRGLGQRLDQQDRAMERIESKIDSHMRDHSRGFNWQSRWDDDGK